MHLHEGLVKVARKAGADLVINARVVEIDWASSQKATVTTARGQKYSRDLLVGADGAKSEIISTCEAGSSNRQLRIPCNCPVQQDPDRSRTQGPR
jgi:2-polyprenyl-6-methoxyphenol hydroxylase-like FAD-dependent oxidoreductase